MVSAGAILDELVERAADRRHSYRRAAAKQCKKRGGKLQGGLQLELFPVEESADEMFERLFP
jgi:hypothetical protein